MSEFPQISKIFVRNLTVLDCAVWDLHKGPLGCSWNVDVEWEGETDPEGVVIDFSAAKKLAKKVIDDLFDHRLLISERLISRTPKGRVICRPAPSTPHAERFLLDTYEESLAVLEDSIFAQLSEGKTEQLAVVLGSAIQQCSPENVRQVKVKLTEHHQSNQSCFFNYLHSLRLHSGNCQRFHGHSNIIEVFTQGQFDPKKSAFAADKLNNKYLVAECYISEPRISTRADLDPFIRQFELDSSDFVWANYRGSQGEVVVRLPAARLGIMPVESTIENIARWVHMSLFAGDPSIEVRAYEGLNKGAVWP